MAGRVFARMQSFWWRSQHESPGCKRLLFVLVIPAGDSDSDSEVQRVVELF